MRVKRVLSFQNCFDAIQTLDVFGLHLELANQQEFFSERTDGMERYPLHQMRAACVRADFKFPLCPKDLIIRGLPGDSRRRIQRRDARQNSQTLAAAFRLI